MKQNLITILRWIGVLPMAIIGNFLVFWIFYYTQSFYHDENSKYVIYFVPVLSSFFSGIAIISAGVMTAPAHKKITGLVLLVVVTLLMGFSTFYNLIERNYLEFIKDISSVIGSTVAFLIAGREEEIFGY